MFALARAPERSDALTRLARESDGRVSVHTVDVADGESVRRVAEEIGDTPIDLLINNAGVMGGDYAEQVFGNMNYDRWREAFEIMTMGPYRMAEAFADKLARREWSKIVTVTSQVGASTWQQSGLTAYGAVKAAANRAIQSMAIDLEPRKVLSIAIHPGYVQTDMGGPSADITPAESVGGMRRVIAGLRPEDSGKFFKWNGEIHPW